MDRFRLGLAKRGGAMFYVKKQRCSNQEEKKRKPATAFSEQVLALFKAKGIDIPAADLVRENAGPDIPPILSTSSAIDPIGIPGLDVIPPDPTLDTPAPSGFAKILDLVTDPSSQLPDLIPQA